MSPWSGGMTRGEASSASFSASTYCSVNSIMATSFPVVASHSSDTLSARVNDVPALYRFRFGGFFAFAGGFSASRLPSSSACGPRWMVRT